MKRRILRHKFALGLITALALASCSQDELSDGGQGTPLPAGKYSLTLTASSIGETVATPATRSTVDNEWSNEQVYVQVYDNYTSGEPQWGNATMQTYTVAKGGTMNKTDGNDVYWQASGEKKAIRAWYVGGNTAKTGELPSSHAVNTDQSKDGYAQSDFLYAGRVSGFSDGKDGVSLQFYHQVAKVKIQIVRGEDTPANFSVTGLTIGGVATQGTYAAPTTFVDDDDSHYGTWSVSGQKIEDITPRNANDKDGQTDSKVLATYEAIVIPQTVSNGTKLFTITAEGYDSFVYTTTAEKEWAPGKEYTYTITIKGDKLEVSVSDGSINWDTDGATGSGEVELP